MSNALSARNGKEAGEVGKGRGGGGVSGHNIFEPPIRQTGGEVRQVSLNLGRAKGWESSWG